MSSYDSNASGYLHGPYHQGPPYPTTPGPHSSSAQGYFAQSPQQQQQPMYSSSPSYTHSGLAHHHSYQHPQQHQQQAHHTPHRRTYSTSSATYPTQPPPPQQQVPPTQHHPLPHSNSIPIHQPQPQPQHHHFQHPASYPPPSGYAPYAPMHRRSTSDCSMSPYDDASGSNSSGGEDNYNYNKYSDRHGQLDSDTEREYERRYARERRMERRPTLGGSLLTMLDTVGKAIGGSGRH